MDLASPHRALGTLPLHTVYCYDGGLYQTVGATETGLVQSHKVADYSGHGSLSRVTLDPVVAEPDLVVEERKPNGEPLEMFGLDCWGWQAKVAACDADDARARAMAADPGGLYEEMAEMANVKPLGEIPAASHVHRL